MILLTILFFMTVYIVLAVVFVFFVWEKTELKIYRWLAVTFVILLPTWDVVLGYVVYYPACLFIPKTAIYETAETEGIYYEGDYKNYIFNFSNGVRRVGLDDLDLEKGYKYIESLITKESINDLGGFKNITPIIYRCVPLERDKRTPNFLPVECLPIMKIKSEYSVKVKKVAFGISEIHFMKVSNISTSKLMGEYNEIIRYPYFPFFNWVRWYDSVGTGIYSCPTKSRFYDFQYEVLKLK